MSNDKEYLGDGLTASFYGFMIKVSTPREDGEHYVYFELPIFENLLEYAKRIGWLKSWEWKA